MEATLNIVELIENNPIARLSDTYQNKLLAKIKTNFTNNEQQLFIASFYCYLNYNQKNDFVIDLDNVWKWLGFSNKAHSKLALEKNFIINKDYKSLLTNLSEQKQHIRGGHNKETFMLNIGTFKRFCLKADEKICGSREEVWNGKAYRTTGGLIKENLLMHKSGKIISKRKCIQETNYNRFIICGVNKDKTNF